MEKFPTEEGLSASLHALHPPPEEAEKFISLQSSHVIKGKYMRLFLFRKSGSVLLFCDFSYGLRRVFCSLVVGPGPGDPFHNQVLCDRALCDLHLEPVLDLYRF